MLFSYTSASSCPGCPGCDYCYLQYPSAVGASCNPFQSMVHLYCTVAGPSSSVFNILWQINGVDAPIDSITPMDCSGPSPASNNDSDGSDVRICTSQLDQSYPYYDEHNYRPHNYSCIVYAPGTGTFSPPSTVLHLPGSLSKERPGCGAYSFTVNDTQCASNQSIVCPPPSTSSASLPSPSTALSSPPITPSNSVNISAAASYMVYLTNPAANSLQPTATVKLNVTVDDNSSPSLTSLWLYVVAGIAAVFALTIAVLCVLCTALCLKRSQTADTDTLKSKCTICMPSF